MAHRVAVTTRSIEVPTTGELRDSLSRDWTTYLDQLGVRPIPVLNALSNPAQYLTEMNPDALLLTNGEDVGTDPPRDDTERQLLGAALDAKIPILGVCRGHQFINDYYGGDLIDLRDKTDDHRHAGTQHDVEINALTESLPARLQVNSYHNMAVSVNGLAEELRPFATADGLVEGSYHPDHPLVSIQWHPERPLVDTAEVDSFVHQLLTGELRLR